GNRSSGELVLDEYLYIIYSPLMGNCLLYWKIVLMFKHCKTCSRGCVGNLRRHRCLPCGDSLLLCCMAL
ncbi:hypothetical protein, partial [Moorena sp. SIO4G3]|uniref:hypothetical protein n=1 Tax=Moorena sp. SIO4G3 TaxID=2607821 RepID=UPI0025D0338B